MIFKIQCIINLNGLDVRLIALCALGNLENLSFHTFHKERVDARTEMCARQILQKIKFIFKADIF